MGRSLLDSFRAVSRIALRLATAVGMVPAVVAQCGTQWSPVPGLGGAVGSHVRAVLRWDRDGSGPLPAVLVVGGYFTIAGMPAATNLAAYDPSTGTWSAFGQGVNGGVHALATLPTGELVVGGEFSIAGNIAFIARWSGTAWAPMGGAFSGGVNALLVLPNGQLIAGGRFATVGLIPMRGVARWLGSTWGSLSSPWPTSIDNGAVYALSRLPNGNLVSGGHYPFNLGPSVWQWTGSVWAAVGNGTSGDVFAFAMHPNGTLFAAGDLKSAGTSVVNRIASYDGVTWAPLGTGMDDIVRSLTMLPGGDLVAGGSFLTAGGVAANRVARWDGSAWSPLGAGTDAEVTAVTVVPTGELMVGGTFTTAGGLAAAQLARLVSTCPAAAVAVGSGCSGSAGPMELTALTLPWLGDVYRYRCTGIATGALGFGLLGLTPQNTPLSDLHPAGGAGCAQRASAESVALLLPYAGAVEHSWALPSNPALVGIVVQNQVMQLEPGAGGSLTWFGSSNALTLTTGTF